jgi:purine-cytosine permease-like protein
MVFSLILSFFSYRAIHLYDRYGWMALLIVFTILAGFGAKHFVNIPMAQGHAAVTGVSAFGATIFSWGILRFPLAADYAHQHQQNQDISVHECQSLDILRHYFHDVMRVWYTGFQ